MPPHLLAFQHGTLHWVPDDKPTMIKFSKAHELRNEAGYLGKTLVSDHVHEGWQRLASIKYLQHKTSGKIVAVVGKATQFLSSLPRYIEHLSPGFAPVFFHSLRLTVSFTCGGAVRRAARVGMVAHMYARYSGRVRDAGSRGGWRTESVLHAHAHAWSKKSCCLKTGCRFEPSKGCYTTPAAPRASGRGEGEALEATRGAIHGVDHTTRGGAFTTIHFHDYLT